MAVRATTAAGRPALRSGEAGASVRGEASERAGSSTPALRLLGYRLVLTPRVGSYSVCGQRPQRPSFRALARSASRSRSAAYLPRRPS